MNVKPWAGLIGTIGALLPAPAAVGAVVLLSACGAGCDAAVNTTALPAVAGVPPSFDAVEIDQPAHRVYVADRTRTGVDVIDISKTSPRFLQTVNVGGPPNGLALARDSNRLYAGLAYGSVVAIDTDPASKTFMTVTDRVSVGNKSADLMDYGGKRVFVGSGSNVVIIDAATNKVVSQVDVKAPVEQPRYNSADGMVYVTSPDADTIFQINPDLAKVTNTFKMGGCKPAGLAINPARQMGLVACSVSVSAVDLRDGSYRLVSGIPAGDIVSYSSAADRFLVASANAKAPSVVGVFSGDAKFITSAVTDPRGHAAVFDTTNQLVYTTSAAGILSFTPPTCAPGVDWKRTMATLGIYATPFVLLALVMIFYSARRDRSRAKAANGSAGPQRRRQYEDDLAVQRERMRSLEDSILGAETVVTEDPQAKHDPWGGFFNST